MSPFLLLFALACADKPAPDDTGADDTADSGDTSESGDSGDTTDSDTSGDNGGDSGETGDTGAQGTRRTATGVVTWAVDFSAEAEAAGREDCSYARTYTGHEDLSLPWLCPACELLVHADVAMDRGEGDCYGEVSSAEPLDAEWLGYADGVWYRGGNSALTERGPSTVEGGTWTVTQDVEGETEFGDVVTYHISGTLTLGEEAGSPYGDWVAPETYACGWPKADPPPYEGDYVLEVGGTVPDALLADVCEEPVRLHDLAGRYLVVDISAMDCGPCQSAAQEEEAFVEDMAAQGIEVMVVTMLAPSLSDVAGTPTTRELRDWIDTFGLHSPVLADRIWGLSVAYPYHGDDFGYPTFILVAPDLTVLSTSVGYGGWDSFATEILADAG